MVLASLSTISYNTNIPNDGTGQMSDRVQLQGIGRVAAKPARDFQVGDLAVWNYGYTSEVVSVSPKGRTQLLWGVKTSDGNVLDRVVKADRLIAYLMK
jgi:hypothetical protein